MILIVSNGDDGHVRAVAAELTKRDAAFLVFDPASFPADASVTSEYAGPVCRTMIRWADGEVCVNDVKSIWYRRPGGFVLSDRLLPDERRWVRSESDFPVGSEAGVSLSPAGSRSSPVPAASQAIVTLFWLSAVKWTRFRENSESVNAIGRIHVLVFDPAIDPLRHRAY